LINGNALILILIPQTLNSVRITNSTNAKYQKDVLMGKGIIHVLAPSGTVGTEERMEQGVN
jgi:hypothetical protein